MKIAMLFSLVISSTLWANSPTDNNVQKKDICLAAREYITTVTYLRDNKDFGLSNKEIIDTADKVSTGCSGSSQRFIKVLTLLSKMGVDTRSSISSSLAFVDKDDKFTKVFIEIYRRAYDPKYLDLDVLTSMKISLKLSAQYTGNIDKSLKDFTALVDFCLKNQSMDLPRPICAKLATDIATLGQDFEKPIAKPFIKLIHFLQDHKNGPKLDRNNSLKVAKNVIKFGPISVKNFEQAYNFAVSKKGLDYTIKQAIPFAIKISSRSIKLESIK